MATIPAIIFETPTASDPAFAEVVRRLVETYRPEGIYLFGSVARGLRRSRAAYLALGAPGSRPTCLFGLPANSIAKRISPPPCQPQSLVRENYSMPHDPALVAAVRAWLSKASKDIAAAEYELPAIPPFSEDILFTPNKVRRNR